MMLLLDEALTFYNVNDTEAQQRWYMISSSCVNCDGSTHAVSNNHDWRRVVAIKRLHHFTNIPFKEEKVRMSCQCVTRASVYVLTRQLTWPSCLQRDRQDFSLWCRLQVMRQKQISPLAKNDLVILWCDYNFII